MNVRFVKVKHHTRPVGKRCMHCGRPATVTATRKDGKYRLSVWYCDEHAEMRGVFGEKGVTV